MAAAIKWYEMERILQGKAAEITGLSRSAFVDALGRYGVSPVQVRPDELEREVEEALGESADSSPSVEDDDE